MYCPKCGLPNTDGTKYCRGCGTGLVEVLAVVDGLLPTTRESAEKHIELYSSGIRGVIIGAGFFLISGLAFAISMRLAVLFLFFLAFGFYFFGTGISRLIQARALRALNKPEGGPALTSGQDDYIKPLRSIYETDDLAGQPLSITEHTTTHLEMDPDHEGFPLPKK